MRESRADLVLTATPRESGVKIHPGRDRRVDTHSRSSDLAGDRSLILFDPTTKPVPLNGKPPHGGAKRASAFNAD